MTNIYTQLAELLNVAQITDYYKHSDAHDLEISEWVYYYQPNFSDVINRIEELNNPDAIVFVSYLEKYLPEYEVEKYIEQNKK